MIAKNISLERAAQPSTSWRHYVVAGLMLILAIGFIGITSWELVGIGPFSWHIKQPESVQGGIEAVLLVALLALAQLLSSNRLRTIVCLLVAELYLRRHAVDFAAAIDLAYLEILIGLGAIVARLSRAPSTTSAEDYLRRFVLGLLVWSLFAWTFSALGYGTLKDLRTLTLALGIGVLAFRPRTLTQFVYRRAMQMPPSTRALIALLLGWLAVLFAKTNVAIGYDSLWYGLRGDRVLVGDGNVFLSQGLVSNVHYYPKLYELLLIPVSGLRNAGVISGMSLMLFVLLTILCNGLLKQLGVLDCNKRLITIIACVTIPVVSNMSLDAKPDILGALLMMLAWLHANEFIKRPGWTFCLWTLTCLVLSTQAKLLNIPYAGALVLAASLTFLWRDRNMTSEPLTQSETRLAQIGFALTLVVTAYITARTVIVAGMPTITPDSLVHLWNAVGFHVRPPVGILNITRPPNFNDAPALALDLLLSPQKLGHEVITWTGNVWLWLALVGMACSLLKLEPVAALDPGYKTGTTVTAAGLWMTGLALMFCVGYGMRGSDGNYFLAAVIPATLVSAAFAWRFTGNRQVPHGAFLASIFAFSLFQAWYSFLSSDWSTGTRQFDLLFSRGIHQYDKKNMAWLELSGLWEIEHYLRNLHKPVRAIGCLPDELSMTLSASSENLQMISYYYPEYVHDSVHLLKFMMENKINFLIMPRDKKNPDEINCEKFPELNKVDELLKSDPGVKRISDKEFIMYNLNPRVRSSL